MKICSYELCSGCSLCADICPLGAIEMEKDSEGFFRPVVCETLCVRCGLCEKKCPVNNFSKEEKAEPEVFAVYSKDKKITKKSSSAGVFHYLAKAVLSDGGVVFGAGYDNTDVVHKGIEDEKLLCDLMGPKYVQSNTESVYSKVKSYLDINRTVLFSGTPCQCAALRSFIGENDKLFLVDIICHGVPSPALWEKYIEECFNDVRSVSFRHKKRGWEEYSMNIESERGSYCRSFFDDPYMRTFLTNVALRPSCYSCQWKGENYFSDITVGDFWGIEKVCPKMYNDLGTSAVIVRSEKGKALFSRVSEMLELWEATLSSVEKANISYRKSTRRPPARDSFYKSMADGESFRELYEKYVPKMKKSVVIKKRIKIRINRAVSKISRLKNEREI